MIPPVPGNVVITLRITHYQVKSFTAKDAKDAKERKSFTTKDTKDAKGNKTTRRGLALAIHPPSAIRLFARAGSARS
jgi:hypothetical protein